MFSDAQKFARLSELTHEDWLNKRREGIGGSDAAAITGLSPYSSPFYVWLEKTEQAPPNEGSLATLIGQELEQTVARLWMQETGKIVQRSGFMWQSKKRPWQIADVDRVVMGENAGLECKTTASLKNMRKLKSGEFPDEYYAQCVHYMAVTGAEKWYLAILEIGLSKKFHTFCIERDETEIEALNRVEEEFWRENVLGGHAPKPDGNDRTDDFIKTEYTESDGTAVGLFGSEKKIAELLELKSQISALEKSAKTIQQELQLTMGDAERGLALGYEINWKTYTRAGGIDEKKLEKEFPQAFAACKKSDTKYRKFEIKEDNNNG